MSTEANKSIARRYFREFWNNGDAATIAEILAPHAVGHVAGKRIEAEPQTLLARRSALLATYSDPAFAIEDEIAEGDRVVVRWTFRGRHTGPVMGAPATGKEVASTGINIFRIVDGRIAELWVESDDLGEMQQLGVLPAR